MPPDSSANSDTRLDSAYLDRASPHGNRIAELRELADLTHIPPSLHEMALSALAERDVIGFLCRASNDYSVEIVFRNQAILRELGILEHAFVDAVSVPRVNNRAEYSLIQLLLRTTDRGRLRAAGAPIPPDRSFTLYRGVAGRGRARRIRGYSWTSERDRAEWFAARGAAFGLSDPAVVVAKIPNDLVLFRTNDRAEHEFFVDLPARYPVKRLTP